MYLGEQRGLGRRSRRAVAVSTAAVAGLVVTGCSGVASVTNSAASKQAPQATASAASTGTSGPGLKLGSAPAASAFGQPTAQAVAASPTGPPADPFSGTPADDWADNSAGLVYPEGAPTGPYTRAEVEDAYVETALLLLTANLNRPVLFSGAPPTAFANLLTSRQKAWFLGGLNKKGVDKQGNPLSTRTLVMSFAPGSAQLVGDTIKVKGTMHAKAVKDSNGAYELDVDVDFTFVYPVEPPSHPDDWMRVVNEVVWTVAFADWQGAASSFAPWVTPVSGKGRVSGIVCGTGDGYWHPAYPVAANAPASPSASPTGTPVDPYVSGQPRPESCQAITGT
jgi:hypothetical protein